VIKGARVPERIGDNVVLAMLLGIPCRHPIGVCSLQVGEHARIVNGEDWGVGMLLGWDDVQSGPIDGGFHGIPPRRGLVALNGDTDPYFTIGIVGETGLRPDGGEDHRSLMGA
jgi:hypothetical protein